MDTICFTGHRPQKLGGYNESNPTAIYVKETLAQQISSLHNERGIRTFITGMALGVDTWAAEAVLDLKAVDPGIRLIAAVPCHGQESMWPEASQKRYRNILAQCDEVRFVTEGPYTPECMQVRNVWMVNNAHAVLAVWDGTSGGTANCVRYATARKRPIVQIHPVQRRVIAGN